MKHLYAAGLLTAMVSLPATAASDGELQRELDVLKEQVQELEARLAETGEESETTAVVVEEESEPAIHVGGALRFQFQRRGRDTNDRATGGEIDIDTFRLNFDGEIKDVIFSAEYRFYPTFDNAHFIHHGWVGYNFGEDWQGRLGIMQVPFGILPYASHNFFFSSNYYLGLEDDYDAGVNFLYEKGPHDLQLAFFKNDEYAGGGGFKRYSYDPLNVSDGTNKESIEEANTVNVRYAYSFGEGTDYVSEVGLSLQGGQIYNSSIDKSGDQWAAAGHLNGDYGPWNLMLQLARYEIDPKVGPGFDKQIIGTGAYAFEYTMPAEAWTYLFNVAYTQNVDIGPISALTYYNDFTYVDKDDKRLEETIQNVIGMSISAGALFTYVDFVIAKNQPFTSPYISSGGFGGAQMTDLGSAVANDWNTRFNINVGYYF